MSPLSFSRVGSGPVSELSAEIENGIHVIVGAEHDGTLELLRLATGRARPQSGSVRVAGKDPYRNPAIRRKIASCVPERFEEKTVREALARRRRLSGARHADDLLGRAGLEYLLPRPVPSLSEVEQRSLRLALALGRAQPTLLALHQPLDEGVLLDQAFIMSELKRHAESAPVVCTTSRPELAGQLSGTALWLESGRLRRATSPTTSPSLRPGAPPTVVVSCSEPGKLARVLVEDPSVRELRYSKAEGTLEVLGEELEALCLAVLGAAQSENVHLLELTQRFPELSEVRALHAALARTAYERAYGSLSKRSSPETHR